MDLNYNINTKFDDSGSKEAAKSMDGLVVSNGEVSKALAKTGEHAEMSERSFRRLALAMGSEMPGAAALMEAGFEGSIEPMLGATFLLLAGIEMLKSAIEKISKEKEQATKISEALADADAEQSKAVDKQREALEKAEVAEAEFHHNFIRNAQNAIDQAEHLAEAVLKTAAAVDESETSRRKGIASAEIEDMEQRGVVSHAVALKMKEQLDIEYEQQRMIRMMAMDKLEEIALQRQLANKQIAGRNSEKAETAAESRYETAATAKAANDAKIEDAQRKIAAGEQIQKELRSTGVTEENIQTLRDSYEKTSGDTSGKTSLSEMFTYLSRHMGGIVPRKLFGTSGDVNLATYEGAQLDVEAGKSDLARARKQQAGLDIAEGNAKSDLDFARQTMQKNRDAVQALQDKIVETTSTNAVKEGGAQMDLGMSKANTALKSDRGIADRIAGGGQVGGADAQKLIADASRIAGHQVDLQTAAQIIENGANNMGIFMNQISRLATVFSQFSPADLSKLNQRIDELECAVGRAAYAADFH
jgi:hypothetical protein